MKSAMIISIATTLLIGGVKNDAIIKAKIAKNIPNKVSLSDKKIGKIVDYPGSPVNPIPVPKDPTKVSK